MANKKQRTIYIGVTSDLVKRVYEHKNRIIKGFTTKYKINKLVYYEEFSDINIAIKREKKLKRWKRIWKVELIESFNEEWTDLYNDLF